MSFNALALVVILIIGPSHPQGALEDAVKKDSSPFPTASPKKSTAKKKPAPKRKAPAKPAVRRVTIPEGTEVPLAFAQELSSKKADKGDLVKFALAEDFVVDGVVVASAGTEATGEVTTAKKAGWLGKDAKLAVALKSMTVGETEILLRGKKTKDGDDSEGIGEAADVVKGIFKKSDNVKIKEGTRFTGYVDSPVQVIIKL